jgi:hypothetical protein
VDELPNRFDLLLPALEDSNFVCDRALAKLVHSEGEIHNGWELNRREIVAMTMDYQAYLG